MKKEIFFAVILIVSIASSMFAMGQGGWNLHITELSLSVGSSSK
ncbi:MULTISPECIES: hypothetical protein [Yersiniaceae]|jgi:hypothetical protein|nr:hypothetical protein [Rahnella sp. AA]